MKFKQYKKYVTKKEDDSHNKHNFYEVTSSVILEAENRLGIRFPKDLRNFYENIGYGFIHSNKKDSINRIIDPHSVADVRLREDVYEYNSEIDEYVEENQLLFFEVVEGLFLSVTLDTQKKYTMQTIL